MKNLVRRIIKKTIPESIQIKLTMDNPYSGLKKLIPLHSQFEKNSFRLVEREGVNFKFDISDIVDWWSYYGFVEIEKVNFMNKIEQNMTIIDVGANIGTFSLPIAKKVGSNGKVYSFEPFLPTFEKLKTNVNLNKNSIENIEVFNFGLGREEETLNFEIRENNNPGMNRVSKEGIFQIEIKPLDQFVTENKINKIDWVKIDVEGFEYEVIMGAKTTIRNFKPNFFIEVNDENLKEQNTSAKSLIEFFENENYKIYSALDFKKVTSKDNFINCHLDILCLSDLLIS